jgi:D-glycero-alpha-D-manno-heptose 1-phosphate guanylyltransferase
MVSPCKNLIIIAGGASSRFSKIYPSTHKMLLPWERGFWIDEFLDVVINLHGFKKVFFSLGIYHKQIIDHLNLSKYKDYCRYVIESEPLGTGGGTLKAFNEFSLNESVVMNCDSLYYGNLISLCNFTLNSVNPICISLVNVNDCSRYGSVTIKNNQLFSFHEKANHGPGLISAGIYKIKKDLFNNFSPERYFSIEHDIFESLKYKSNIRFIKLDGKYIDIGTPEDYKKQLYK